MAMLVYWSVSRIVVSHSCVLFIGRLHSDKLVWHHMASWWGGKPPLLSHFLRSVISFWMSSELQPISLRNHSWVQGSFSKSCFLMYVVYCMQENCREICYAIFKSSVVLTAEFIIQMPEMLPHFENAAQVSMNTPRQTNGHGWSETNFVGATCDSSAFLALRNP